MSSHSVTIEAGDPTGSLSPIKRFYQVRSSGLWHRKLQESAALVQACCRAVHPREGLSNEADVLDAREVRYCRGCSHYDERPRRK